VTDDHLYLAMEYFARGDLRKRMSEGLTARQSLACARDLAYALEAIHEVGIFHRDLKPGNVMLRDDGSFALIDFGLAKHVALKMEVTDKGLIFGTPHYMSPEQGHGKPIDGRSDIYALGVMLYEMLTGKKPFDADNHMAILVHHAKAPIPKLPERLATLQPIVDKLLAKEPADRPDNASDAARMINAVLLAMPPQMPASASTIAPVLAPVLTPVPATVPASATAVAAAPVPVAVPEPPLAPSPLPQATPAEMPTPMAAEPPPPESVLIPPGGPVPLSAIAVPLPTTAQPVPEVVPQPAATES
jgi:serine/threonine protein kinase